MGQLSFYYHGKMGLFFLLIYKLHICPFQMASSAGGSVADGSSSVGASNDSVGDVMDRARRNFDAIIARSTGGGECWTILLTISYIFLTLLVY